MALTSPVPIVTGPLAYSDGQHRATAPIWIVHTAVAHTARAGRRIRHQPAHLIVPALAVGIVAFAATALAAVR